MLDLAEALGAPVVDSDGRYAFPSTHPLNLTNAREDALTKRRRRAGARCSESRRAAGTVGARARQLCADHFAELQSDSYHVARSRTAELGERQHVALARACADRGRYRGGIAAIARAGARTLGANKDSAKQVQERRAKVEAIYHETRKKARNGSKKPGTKNRSRRRAFSARSTSACKENPGRWFRRTGGAGAK